MYMIKWQKSEEKSILLFIVEEIYSFYSVVNLYNYGKVRTQLNLKHLMFFNMLVVCCSLNIKGIFTMIIRGV